MKSVVVEIKVYKTQGGFKTLRLGKVKFDERLRNSSKILLESVTSFDNQRKLEAYCKRMKKLYQRGMVIRFLNN